MLSKRRFKMKITKILSIFLAIALLVASLSSCVGFATSQKEKEWKIINLSIAVKYLIYVDSSHADVVDAEFGEEQYEFEYAPVDMPTPNALDVLEDYAYLEYDYKLVLDSDGNLQSVGDFASGTFTYNEIEYGSSWILNVNGVDQEGNMADYKVKEGDNIVFYLYLVPRA